MTVLTKALVNLAIMTPNITIQKIFLIIINWYFYNLIIIKLTFFSIGRGNL